MSIYHFEQSQHLLSVVAMHLTSLLVIMFELDSDEKKKKIPSDVKFPPLQISVLISHQENRWCRRINVLRLG